MAIMARGPRSDFDAILDAVLHVIRGYMRWNGVAMKAVSRRFDLAVHSFPREAVGSELLRQGRYVDDITEHEAEGLFRILTVRRAGTQRRPSSFRLSLHLAMCFECLGKSGGSDVTENFWLGGGWCRLCHACIVGAIQVGAQEKGTTISAPKLSWNAFGKRAVRQRMFPILHEKLGDDDVYNILLQLHDRIASHELPLGRLVTVYRKQKHASGSDASAHAHAHPAVAVEGGDNGAGRSDSDSDSDDGDRMGACFPPPGLKRVKLH